MVHWNRLVHNELMKIFLRTLSGFLYNSFACRICHGVCLFVFAISYLRKMSGNFLTNTFLLPVVELFALIIAADAVSSEYGDDDVSLDLADFRSKILLSKYASVLLLLLAGVLLLAAVFALYGWVFFGSPVRGDSGCFWRVPW